MNYRFLPRFYYTFPYYTYLRSFFKSSKYPHLPEPFTDEKTYFFNYARTGLRLLLGSLKIHPLTVGVQAYTCQTVFQSIREAGHNIKFLDIDENFQLDLEDLKRKVHEIDVLILTHTFGYPDDFESVRSITGDKIIIEDCAHSFLSKSKTLNTGSMGDAAIFSMGLGKLPPIGQGGIAIINNPSSFPEFNDKYSNLPTESFLSEIIHFVKIFTYSLLLRPPLYGPFAFGIGKKLDSRLDFMQKKSFRESKGYKFDRRLFLNSFAQFQDLVLINKKNFDSLELKSSANIRLPTERKGSSPNYYGIPLLTKKREYLMQKLSDNGFEAGRHFASSLDWAEQFGYREKDCPTTEKVVKQILTIPAHKGINSMNISKLSKLINASEEIQ